MSAKPFFDGNYDLPLQHGPAMPRLDPVTRSMLWTVKYHQKASKWVAAKWGLRGPSGSFLVEESEPSDSGIGGVVEWTRIFAAVPRSRYEYEDHVHNMQGVIGSDILELPIYVTAAVRYDYFNTLKPEGIQLFEAFRAVKVGADIYLLGQQPQPGALIVSENSELRRWRGNIYERATRYVRQAQLTGG